MNWLCKFGFHKWTKWSDAKTMSWNTDNGLLGFLTQKRTCEKCGKYEPRKV